MQDLAEEDAAKFAEEVWSYTLGVLFQEESCCASHLAE